uniref:Peptidase S1 domain-containing protein n=1 Tax=Globodera pallida TaxID=36090 RepID=A0A183C3J4_GLOPA
MRMVSKEKCRLQYAKTQDMPKDDPINAIEKRLYEYHLADKICVVPEPSVTEPGDSGSPLLSKIGQYNWVQVGVLHGGNDKRCVPNDLYSTKGLYSAYTPIDCDWIADVTDGEVKCRGW